MRDLILSTLVIINLIGFANIGAYYGQQLTETNPLLWIFTPDCPLASLFFATALLLILLGKEQKALTQLGIATSIKYGLWTLIVLIPNINYYGNTINTWFLIITHALMIIQTIFVIKHFKLSKHSIPAFTYLLINDLSDYLLNTHPPLPQNYIPFMSFMTPTITIITILISYLIPKQFTNKRRGKRTLR